METRKSLYSYVLDSVTDKKEPMLIYNGRSISAEKLLSTVLRAGEFLREQGITKDDVVGIMLPNIPEAIYALYASNAIDAICNLINPRMGKKGLENLLIFTETKIVYTLLPLYLKHKDTFKKLRIKVVICSTSGIVGECLESLLFHKLTYFNISLPNRCVSPVETDGSEIAVYIHSGGTTGTPKTVMLSSYALNSLANNIVTTVRPNGDYSRAKDATVMMLPIFHAFGLGVVAHTMLASIKVVLLPRFMPRKANRLIKKYKATYIAGVPAMYRKMLEKDNFDGKTLEFVFCGGDKLASDVKEKFNQSLIDSGSNCEILEGYGLTETSSVVSVGENGKTNKGSLGTPLKGNLIEIVDDEGNTVEIGEVGNIIVSANSLMTGYLKDEETTKEVIFEKNGKLYLKTGDLGRFDIDGKLYFVERKKRSIKIGAINVFPSEIENVVCEIDGIKACCAARKYNANGKALISLHVVSEDGIDNTELIKKIEKEIAYKLHPYAVPREFHFEKSLKMTMFGKIDYKYYEK